MSVLRTLASLLGRMFDRLARALLSWSRGPAKGAADAAVWAQSPDDGPPEHWLRYIRQRSPWLVRGNRSAPPTFPARAAASPVEHREPPRASARAPEPPRPAGGRPRMILPRPEPSAAPPAAPTPDTNGRSASAPPARAVPKSAVVWRADPPVGAKVIAPLAGPKRDPIPAPVPELVEGGRLADPVVPEADRVMRGGPAFLDAESPSPSGARRAHPSLDAEGAGVEWPALPLRGLAEKLASSGEDSGSAGARTAPAIDGMRLVGGSASLKPGAEGRKETGARSSAQRGPEFQEEDRWPDLPDTRSRGEEWEVPSSRSLEREQLRLTRLRAEQAGSSWSGPPS